MSESLRASLIGVNLKYQLEKTNALSSTFFEMPKSEILTPPLLSTVHR